MSDVESLKLRVLDALTEDANRARKQVANELNISESYLSKLIKELVDEDKLINRFTISINHRKLGYGGNYFSLIKIGDQHAQAFKKLADQLIEMPEAVEVYTVYGDDDFYVRWICRDGDELMTKLNTILADKEIVTVRTFALGQEYKRTNGPALSEKKDDPH